MNRRTFISTTAATALFFLRPITVTATTLTDPRELQIDHILERFASYQFSKAEMWGIFGLYPPVPGTPTSTLRKEVVRVAVEWEGVDMNARINFLTTIINGLTDEYGYSTLSHRIGLIQQRNEGPFHVPVKLDTLLRDGDYFAVMRAAKLMGWRETKRA